MLAFAGDADVRDVVDLDPVDAAKAREDEDVRVGRADEELLDEIVAARAHADAAAAAARLLAVAVLPHFIFIIFFSKFFAFFLSELSSALSLADSI